MGKSNMFELVRENVDIITWSVDIIQGADLSGLLLSEVTRSISAQLTRGNMIGRLCDQETASRIATWAWLLLHLSRPSAMINI
jgi:hypothetical protein